MNSPRLHVVRDIERALAMAAGVAVAFALLLGAVAPAARQPEEVRAASAAQCERDEPGAAIPVEPPAAGPSCPSDRTGSQTRPRHTP